MLVLSLLAGINANLRMDCSECLDEMHGLNQLIQMGGQTIEDFLITNYCPTVSPDPNSHIQCERDLAGNYVILLEMVVEHFFVEGAEHICKAMGVCPIRESDRLPKIAEYTCQECIEGLEWVEAYMRDPLWVAEYTLYLEENFCPTQAATQRCVDLVKEHFPPMHSMAVEEFWIPEDLCGLQPVCGGSTSSSPETTPGSNLLELVSLESYQMGKAICNDGTPAVYYRKPLNEASDTKKLLIYLKGGGMCVPNLPGHKCQPRCQGNNPLCTAATAPYYDPVQSNHGDDIFSPDPAINPAFYDYQYAYVPYCSSDVYTGTKYRTEGDQGFYFHGHYIINAILDDLVENTWITEAEEVVLMGSSAGAEGTDANCDLVAETLHYYNPSMKVKCVSDSGSIYPLNTHTEDCDPQQLIFSFTEAWGGELDTSCQNEHPDGKAGCVSVTTAYPYLSTPILILHSSTDKTIRYCFEPESNTDFWQQWKDELAAIGQEMAAARPDDIGLFLVNCPFHGALGNSYDNMEVPLLDSTDPDEKILLRETLYNFIKETHPYQAIDDMTTKNPN